MPTPNPHLDQHLKDLYEAKQGARARNNQEAATVVRTVIATLNDSLQKGSWCQSAGKEIHSLLKVGVFALNQVLVLLESRVAQDQAAGKQELPPPTDAGPYWQNDAHRFRPFS